MNNKLPEVQVNCTFDDEGKEVTRVKFYGDLHTAIERIAESYHQNVWEGYMNGFEVIKTSKINARLEKLCKAGYEFIDEALGQFLECQKGNLARNIKTIMLGKPTGTFTSKYDWSAMSAKEALKSDCPFDKAVAIDLMTGKVLTLSR